VEVQMSKLKEHSNRVAKRETICEVHRRIYRKLIENPNENAWLIGQLEIAYDMAKKMNNKLRQYKNGYDDGWWKKNRLAGDSIDKKDDK